MMCSYYNECMSLAGFPLRFFFFFFSSRRRHTRWTGDWSSDVCSSDLLAGVLRSASPVEQARTVCAARTLAIPAEVIRDIFRHDPGFALAATGELADSRSEERRVGKECRSRWWPDD